MTIKNDSRVTNGPKDSKEAIQYTRRPYRGSPRTTKTTNVPKVLDKRQSVAVGHETKETNEAFASNKTTKLYGSPNRLQRCKSGGAFTRKEIKGPVYAEKESIKMPAIIDRTPQPSPNVHQAKAIEALQLENEHLHGLIQVMEIKVKKTEDLEQELALLRNAIAKDQENKI